MWKPPVLETFLIVIAILALVGIAVPMVIRVRDNADRLQCLHNLEMIGQGIKEWSRLHDYALPPGRGMSGFCNAPDGKPLKGNLYAVEPGLNALWDKGNGVIKDVSVFRCPSDRNLIDPPAPGEDFTDPRQLSYGMTGDLYPTDVANKVVAADKSDKAMKNGSSKNSANHGHRFTNVLFFDGTVRTCDQPFLTPGIGSELGSIYIRESGTQNDTYIE